MEDVNIWLSEIDKRPNRPPEPTPDVPPQKNPPEGEHVAQEDIDKVPQSSLDDLHDEISRLDSVSNTGIGSKSSVSTTSSAQLKTEAEVAALHAHQRMLKHAKARS